MKTIQLIVSGRVQGVCFRAFTQKQAVKYGVTGFAKNKGDGSVEIIACADQKQLEYFISECKKGPIMAKVSQVIVSEFTTAEAFTRFDIR